MKQEKNGKPSRVRKAEAKRDYVRASYYYADHLMRAGARAWRKVCASRNPINFVRIG